MRFAIDAMLPPLTCALLSERGHEAVTPLDLGAHNLPDDTIIQLAADAQLTIVTENAQDFAHATICAVLLIRKSWWPPEVLAPRLARALDLWAADNPVPGSWAHWLTVTYR
ncbi:MAG: DUF5615 family PIN-like protein [Euzebya sp.]